MTRQPNWKLRANLGDAAIERGDPSEGGYLIWEDETGVYPPEGEYITEPVDDGGPQFVYRFTLDRCTLTDGVLSDNPYYPKMAAWFADDLAAIATFTSSSVEALQKLLCSERSIDRAAAYMAIGDYHGYDNLDAYPLMLTAEGAAARYAHMGEVPA